MLHKPCKISRPIEWLSALDVASLPWRLGLKNLNNFLLFLKAQIYQYILLILFFFEHSKWDFPADEFYGLACSLCHSPNPPQSGRSATGSDTTGSDEPPCWTFFLLEGVSGLWSVFWMKCAACQWRTGSPQWCPAGSAAGWQESDWTVFVELMFFLEGWFKDHVSVRQTDTVWMISKIFSA